MTPDGYESRRKTRKDSGYPNVIELFSTIKIIVTYHEVSFAVYIGEVRAKQKVIREGKLFRART